MEDDYKPEPMSVEEFMDKVESEGGLFEALSYFSGGINTPDKTLNDFFNTAICATADLENYYEDLCVQLD